MEQFRSLLPFVSAFSLFACTSTLHVEKVAFDDLKPVTGFRYALPLTQFDIQMTRRATACVSTEDGADLTDPDNLYVDEGRLIISNEVTVAPDTVDDMDAIFVIDPRSISSYFNRSGFAIEYHKSTRRIKTVNASSKDQLAPAIVSIAKSVAGLGAVTAGPGGSKQLACIPGLAAKVKLANQAGGELASAAEALQKTNAEVKRIRLAQAQLLPTQSPVLANDLANQLEIQADQIEAVRLATAQYVLLSKDVIIKHAPLIWPRRASEYQLRGQFVPTLQEIRKLATIAGDDDDVDYPTAAQRRQFQVDIVIEPECGVVTHRLKRSIERCGAGPSTIENDPPIMSSTMGIYYREPVAGRLLLTSALLTDSEPKVIHNKKYEISQLGFVDSLPVKAQPFESIEFSAEFADDGRLNKGGYKDTEAPAAALGSVLETLSEFEDAKQAERDAELAADVTRLENEKKLAEAEIALRPENLDAVATLNSLQTTLATLQAEQSIAEARAISETAD